MARIRTIKPEYWQDEKLAPLPPIDRLVFLALISLADDQGRLVYNVRTLDGLIFPMTDDSCVGSIETLRRLSRILIYVSQSGQRLIQVVGWDRHQRVANPSKELLPAPSPEDLKQLEVTKSSRGSKKNLRRTDVESTPPIPIPSDQDTKIPTTKKANGKQSWLTPYAEAWEAKAGGKPKFEALAAELRPLEKADSPETVLQVWRYYLAHTETKYCSASSFASKYGDWKKRATPGFSGYG